MEDRQGTDSGGQLPSTEAIFFPTQILKHLNELPEALPPSLWAPCKPMFCQSHFARPLVNPPCQDSGWSKVSVPASLVRFPLCDFWPTMDGYRGMEKSGHGCQWVGLGFGVLLSVSPHSSLSRSAVRVQAALTRPEEAQGPYLGTLPLTFCHAHVLQSNVPAESQSPTVVGSQVRHARGLCHPLPGLFLRSNAASKFPKPGLAESECHLSLERTNGLGRSAAAGCCSRKGQQLQAP